MRGYKLFTDHKIAFTRSNGLVRRAMSHRRILFHSHRDGNVGENIYPRGLYRSDAGCRLRGKELSISRVKKPSNGKQTFSPF